MASKKVNNKCAQCQKTVYVTERLQIDDAVLFHKACFRCAHCNNIIKLGSFAALEGKYYCKPHFKQLFARNGNYNQGFGTLKHSDKWLHKQEPAPEVHTSVTTAVSTPEVSTPEPPKVEETKSPVEIETVAVASSSPSPSPDEAQTALDVSETEVEEKELPYPGLTAEEVKLAEQHFIKYDSNGNGSIDRAEMYALLVDVTKGRKSEDEVRRLADLHFESADKDRSETIDEREFLDIYAKLIKVQID